MAKPLELNRILFTWICICPADDSTSIWWRLGHKIFAFIVFTLNLTAATATLLFVLENQSENLKDDFFALAITVCFYAANVAMMLEYRYHDTIIEVFEHLDEVYDASMYRITVTIMNCASGLVIKV